VTTSFSQSRIQADVSADGVWRKRTLEDSTQIFKLDAAHIFSDRWQAGFSVPLQNRAKAGSQGGTSSGLGDVAFQAAYEYMPDWDYSPLRPKGVGFLTLTLPTGKSIYESLETDGGLSARGRGFLAIGTGTVLTKIYRAWDLSATLEGHRSFAKSFQENTITPGYGGSLSLGGGWNTQFFRIGGALSWNQEDAVDVSGSVSSKGSLQRYATGTLAASYIFPDLWAGTISYSDQSLFGNPANTSLSQSILVLLQKRWNR